MTPLTHLSGQKILVTGASGFIGSHLGKNLLQNKSIEVHAVSRSAQPTDENLINWWHGDLEDRSITHNIIRQIKPDIIYHLASNVTGSRAIEHVLPTLYANFLSTINILTVATKIGCSRIVLAGSLEEPELDQVLTVPSSPYAAAKWSSSMYARMFYELYQTPVVIAKIFMTYGPGQDSRFLVPYVISSLLKGLPPRLSSGKRPIDWIYIDDLINGLLKMAYTPGIEGSTIDLGLGKLVTVREVVQQIVLTINPEIHPLFGAIEDRVMEQVRVANSAVSYAKLDWKPQVSLEEGLGRTVDWYAKHLKRN